MDKLKKCIWIVNTVAAAGDAGITLTELNRKWTADPEKDPTATKFDDISYDEVISRGIKDMDIKATAMCRENNLRI